MKNFAASIESGRVLKDIKSKKYPYWEMIGQKVSLSLFHEAAYRIPAYKDFLKRNKIDHRKVRSFKDFALVPPTSKENYLHMYPFDKLFWDGTVKKPFTIHATSGSTGESTYFQRDRESDLVREVILEGFFRNNHTTIEGPTLFVVTFGMGVWSAGMGIYSAAYLMDDMRHFPVAIVTPGINKAEITKILRKLCPRFRQTIIAGYPPFVKDIIDNAMEDGIDVRKLNLRIIFTGEAFTEEFRDYLLERGAVKNIFADTMNTYGTSELGAIAVETPLTIWGRRAAYNNKRTFQKLFGETTKTPTLAQYIPYFVNFECVDGELYLTGRSPAPLIRYQSGDHGGVMSAGTFRAAMKESGIETKKELRKVGIERYTNDLPLVYVYERKNLATTLYGILIYPEFVKAALLGKSVNSIVSGKFTMLTKYDHRHNQHLEINLELRRGRALRRSDESTVRRFLHETLRRKSSEFRELSDHAKGRDLVKLVFWPYEYPKYFSLGNKHKWVKK